MGVGESKYIMGLKENVRPCELYMVLCKGMGVLGHRIRGKESLERRA